MSQLSRIILFGLLLNPGFNSLSLESLEDYGQLNLNPSPPDTPSTWNPAWHLSLDVSYISSFHLNNTDSRCKLVSRWGLQGLIILIPTNIVDIIPLTTCFDSFTHYFIFYSEQDMEENEIQPFLMKLDSVKYKAFLGNEEGIYSMGTSCDTVQPTRTLDIQGIFPNCLGERKGKTTVLSVASRRTNFELYEDPETHKWQALRGVVKDVLEGIAQRMNLTWEYTPAKDGVADGGDYVGAIDDVMRDRADLAVPVTLMYPRNHKVDFSFPLRYDGMAFTVRIQVKLPTWKSLYKPLGAFTWLLFAGMLGLSAIAYFGLKRITIGNTGKYCTISTLLLVTVDQPIELEGSQPIMNSERCLIGGWILYVLLMSTAYKSKLVSSLVYPEEKVFARTIPELANSVHRVWFYDLGGPYMLMKASNDPTFDSMLHKAEIEVRGLDCFQRLLTSEDTAVCMSQWSTASYTSGKHFGNDSFKSYFYTSDRYFFSASCMIGKKGYPLVQEMNWIMQIFEDTGLTGYWITKDQRFLSSPEGQQGNANVTELEPIDEQESVVISTKHVQGVFVFFLVFNGFAIVLFILEVLRSRIRMCK